MTGWFVMGLIIVVIFLISIKIYGSSERRFGKMEERRTLAKEEIDRIDRALEELSSPLPDRGRLVNRWMRRIQKNKDGDPPVSDS